jgi:hypothetical protein
MIYPYTSGTSKIGSDHSRSPEMKGRPLEMSLNLLASLEDILKMV